MPVSGYEPTRLQRTASACGAFLRLAAGQKTLYFLFVLCDHLGGGRHKKLPVALGFQLETGRDLCDALHHGCRRIQWGLCLGAFI